MFLRRRVLKDSQNRKICHIFPYIPVFDVCDRMEKSDNSTQKKQMLKFIDTMIVLLTVLFFFIHLLIAPFVNWN